MPLLIIPFLTDLDSPRRDCWVCYDSERTDAGPMIFPCKCKGDLAAVHHDCLKRWLIEVEDTLWVGYWIACVADAGIFGPKGEILRTGARGEKRRGEEAPPSRVSLARSKNNS